MLSNRTHSLPSGITERPKLIRDVGDRIGEPRITDRGPVLSRTWRPALHGPLDAGRQRALLLEFHRLYLGDQALHHLRERHTLTVRPRARPRHRGRRPLLARGPNGPNTNGRN